MEGATDPGTERSAADIKALHGQLAELTNDELRSIPILAPGTALAGGASYLDLGDLKRGQFTARAGMVAADAAYIVPRKEVDYQLWDRLVAIVEARQTP